MEATLAPSKGPDLRAVLRSLAVAVSIAGLGCGGAESSAQHGGAPADSSAVPPEGVVSSALRLQPGGAVIVPGIADGTEWLGRADGMAHDAQTDRLLVLDRMNLSVHELTSAGERVRSYGGRYGSGPGELRYAEAFVWSDTYVGIFAAANARLPFFRRTDGSFSHELRTAAHHRRVAMLGKDRVVFVPGAQGYAFDVYSLDGAPVGSRGDPGLLSDDCASGDCAAAAKCQFCEVLLLGDSLILLAETTRTRLLVFDTTGVARTIHDLERDNDLVRSWREEDGANPTRPTMNNGVASLDSKSYILHLSEVPGGLLGIAIAPSLSAHRRHGYEYWRLHPLTGEVERYLYDRRNVGFAAVGGAWIFARDVQDEGIYRYALPR